MMPPSQDCRKEIGWSCVEEEEEEMIEQGVEGMMKIVKMSVDVHSGEEDVKLEELERRGNSREMKYKDDEKKNNKESTLDSR